MEGTEGEAIEIGRELREVRDRDKDMEGTDGGKWRNLKEGTWGRDGGMKGGREKESM